MTSDSPTVADEVGPGAEGDAPATEGGAAATRDGAGSRARCLRGSLVFILGAVAALAVGGWHDPFPAAVTLAIVGLALAAVGLVDGLGLIRKGAPVADALPLGSGWLAPLPGESRWLAPGVSVPVAVVVAGTAALVGGPPVVPGALTVSLLILVPAALRRAGLFVVVATLAIHLPTLGVFGLWDPWETHYAEVAREILARNDWISLWWAQEEWFWSKPVGIFWAEAISLRLFGVDPTADAHPLAPEWAVRLPVLVTSVLATGAVYLATARVFGKRAGVLAAVVLTTMPHFFTLTRQAMTDMPFIGHVTIAICLLMLAVVTDPDETLGTWRVGPLAVAPQAPIIAGIVMLGLPQALYLVSRNLTFFPEGIAVHPDRFFSGSPGNADVPGNEAMRFDLAPRFDGPLAQPAVQGLLWLLLLGVAVWGLRRERRAQPLLMVGFYVACALAFLGKGIPGFALPGLVALLFLMVSGRWGLLLEGRLRTGLGAAIVVALGLPWFVAMTTRHGPPFLDRLLVHDHLKRLGTGVHGDEGSLGYFLEQLGYATFPWAGLVLVAALLGVHAAQRRVDVTAVSRRRAEAATARRDMLVLVVLWLFATFTLFNAMVTKFHHYIAPVVPPAAILVGLLLDRALAAGKEPQRPVPPVLRGVAIVAATLGAGALAAGFGSAWGDLRGIVPAGTDEAAMERWVLDHPAPAWVTRSLLVAAVALLVGAHRLERGATPSDFLRAMGLRSGGPSARSLALRWALLLGLPVAALVGGTEVILLVAVAAVLLAILGDPGEPGTRDARRDLPFALAAAGGAALVSLVGRDLSWTTNLRPQGSEHLVQLFIYNYGRPFPEHLDYRAPLTGFTAAAGVLYGLLALRGTRRTAVHGLVGLAVVFTVWTVDVYLMDLSPHWSQRELIDRYYALREGPDEPLVAFQMNWKGENFYTGNRVHAFVDIDTDKLERWVADQDEGRRVFFLLEEGRIARLERALGDGRPVEKLTDNRLCNKFVLVQTVL